ncbi:MAG: hypothetical protein K2P94_14230 [Rhodospirillaceae bacterium]|nr:hypothetical protein [Rhodospirillaceae bacterium]
MKRTAIAIIAATLALTSLPVAAQDAKPSSQPTPPCADQSYCGVSRHMAEMEKRMVRMRDDMDQCAKGIKHCDKDRMATAMKDMQERMGQMTNYMKAIPE